MIIFPIALGGVFWAIIAIWILMAMMSGPDTPEERKRLGEAYLAKQNKAGMKAISSHSEADDLAIIAELEQYAKDFMYDSGQVSDAEFLRRHPITVSQGKTGNASVDSYVAALYRSFMRHYKDDRRAIQASCSHLTMLRYDIMGGVERLTKLNGGV